MELNDDELNEQIIAYSRGSVAGYDILSEDGSKADEGVYSVKVRVRVERDMIRDGVKTATNKTATVSFRPADLKPEKEHLDPVTVQSTDAINTTNKGNESQGAELLLAMLERYNPEDFITFRTVGKVTPVKDKEDFVQVLVEVSFNDKLYNEAFIPDLKQVLGQIAAKKKDITLTKQRDIIRRIRDKKGAPLADSSVIMSGSNLGKDFNLAVFDKPDRFGCTVYQFKKEETDKILNNETGILAQFRSRIAAVKGFEIELTDENDSPIETTEHTIMMPFLLTDNVIRDNVWAFHPTLMQYQDMYSFVPLYIENKQITIPLRFELPEEFQKITRNIKANLLTDEDFSSAWLKTRKWLHNAALNNLKNGATISHSLLDEAGGEYPLSLAALQVIEAQKVASNNSLLAEEVIDHLSPMIEAGNYEVAYSVYNSLLSREEANKAKPYLNTAAKINPEAMIIAGNNNEGMRILSLLASQGQPNAANALGNIYLNGIGVRKDTRIAARYAEVVKTGVPMSTSDTENEYPLALAARQSEEVRKIMSDDELTLDEAIYRLTPFAEAGNYTALYAIACKYEDETWDTDANKSARWWAAVEDQQEYDRNKVKSNNLNNYLAKIAERKKEWLLYLTKAAAVHPEAMIRMGETQEQGFHDVKVNPKRAKAYFDEGIRLLSLFAFQGLPSAAAELGHVYIEGLGTKQDIPRATRYFEFARKAGYYHPELWLWEHYGVTMRQVTIPEKVKERIRDENARTCILLVREKFYADSIMNNSGRVDEGVLVNLPSLHLARKFMNNKKQNSLDSLTFSLGDSGRYGDDAYFSFKPDK